MKILIDMQSVQAGSGKGGIGRYSYNLLDGMIRNNKSHNIFVLLNEKLSTEICDKLYKILPKKNIYTFEAFEHTAEKVQANHFRSESSKLIREYVVSLINPDLFFITSFVEGYFDNVVTSLEGIYPENRTVIILYDLIPLVQQDKYLINPMIKKHYLNRISAFKKCALSLSISQFSKDEALQMLEIPENKIINISSGVDTKFKPIKVSNIIKDNLYKKYNIKNKFLMYTSSFDVRKNQAGLISAFALLDENIKKDYQLLLIGNGSPQIIKELRTHIKDVGLEKDEVIFLGYIDDKDLLNLYNLATLFVFPSFSEGFGLPALEAMNCELATIGSNTTSIVEVINNKNALFNPTDIYSIKDKILQVLSDEKFENDLKSEAAIQAKNFSWDITAIKTLEALETVYNDLDLNNDKKYQNKYNLFIEKISQIANIKNINDKELIELSNYIDRNIKKYNKKIGIISTWNTRCGIASYTKYLSQKFIDDSIIFAPKVADKELTDKDESNVLRIWKLANDDLTEMLKYILDIKLETIFIQFNYGFFNFKYLDIFISTLVKHGIKVHITFHSTADLIKDKQKQLKVIKSLNKCTTLFIHTQKDIINLNKIGLKDNIELFNQGIIDIYTKKTQQKNTKLFKLATYGFFLETKGFINMIEAFKLLIDDGYKVSLLMLNAKYSDAASSKLIKQAKDLINKYNLQNYIELNTDYLSDLETVTRLSEIDLIVYPYQKTGESSSAAIRMAIAANTNIGVTPQPIFNEVKDFSFIFNGDTIDDLSEGIKNAIETINKDNDVLLQMAQKREYFRNKNLYSKLSKQLKNILIPQAITKQLNIKIDGTYDNDYSLSIVNKSIALALQKCENVEVKIDPTQYHLKYMEQYENVDKNIKPLVSKKLENIDVTIRNIYPPYTTNMQGDYKIVGPYGWEESKFPSEYVEWFNKELTMIFAMSDYVKNTLKENGVNIPIITTGLVVEDILNIESKSLNFEVPNGFRLLHISSCFPRKGLNVLLKAFEQINIDDLVLIIKTFPNPHNDTLKQLNDLGYKVKVTYEENVVLYVKGNKQIILINKHLPQEQIKYLYENSNILVAPSFGEGFGLPMAEAMLLNLPVITTGHGGQTDFCTQENSWLLDFYFDTAKTHMNLKGSIWAVPKVESIKEKILEVKQHPDNSKLKKAKEYILTKYSSKQVAQNIQNAIKNYKKL